PRIVQLRGKCICRRSVVQEPLLAGPSAGAGVAAIRQRNEPRSVGNDVAEAPDEAGEKISIPRKVDDDTMARSCRDRPDDHALTVACAQRVLLGVVEAGLLWRRAHCRRNRKNERALREEQRREPTDVSERRNDEDPFQHYHGSSGRTSAYDGLRRVFVSLATSCLMVSVTWCEPLPPPCAACHLMRWSRVALVSDSERRILLRHPD